MKSRQIFFQIILKKYKNLFSSSRAILKKYKSVQNDSAKVQQNICFKMQRYRK